MSEHLKRALEKQSRELAGPSHIEQHIILLKLSELMGNAPESMGSVSLIFSRFDEVATP